MRQLYYAAAAYATLGLLAGLAYREITKAHAGYHGFTQLSVLHTHLFALGMLVFLVLLGLEKLFTLTAAKVFPLFFWPYNAGLLVTVGVMVWHGYLQVLDTPEDQIPSSVSGLAGFGHILLTVGIVALFVALWDRLQADTRASGPGSESERTAPRD